jgi:uncharacterized SAM-binding protein YcdF (DUF218 family)
VDTYVLLKFAAQAILPPTSFALGLLVGGILALMHRTRLAKAVACLAIAQVLLSSIPVVSDTLIMPLEAQARKAAKQAPRCCYAAIVVLGGGVTPASPPDLDTPDLNEAADRVWHGARLYRQGLAARIIVSGGVQPTHARASQTEADAMRILLIELGVPSEVIVLEAASRNTGENLAFVRRMMGEGRIALVTSAFHMPRALRLARRMGLDAAAFPTDFRTAATARPAWDNWLLTVEALKQANTAMKEYMALAFDARH